VPAGPAPARDRPGARAAVPASAAPGVILGAEAGAEARQGRLRPAVIRTTTLDSGLRVVTEAMPDVRSVTAGYWVGTGGRDEEAGVVGASHFLEHLLFKGTPTRSARSIAEAVDAVGGDMNAFTTKEYTAFYVRVLSEHLDLGLDVLCDIMWSPSLAPSDLDSERQVILEEILMHADEPADLVHELFSTAQFPGHPLGREVLGSEDSIAAMTAEEVRGFFASHYRPANMVMAAAGDLEHEAVVKAVEARFAGLPGGQGPARTAPVGAPNALAVTTRPTEQAHVVLGVRGPDRHDPQRWAVAALNHVLGGGLSSRLFQEIRETRGLAYSVYSDQTSFEDAGSVAVYVGTSPDRAMAVVDLVTAELDNLVESGITERELVVAHAHLRADTLLALEDSGARMSRIGQSLLLHGEVLEIADVLARIEAVTLEEVYQAARDVLGGPRTLAVVGPFDQSDFAGRP